jgi:peroxin-12
VRTERPTEKREGLSFVCCCAWPAVTMVSSAGLSVKDFLDPTTPTFFEMTMADGVVRSLRPAFLHMLSAYARSSRNIGMVGMYILGYNEEVFLLLRSIVDGYYLRNEEATFIEDFYGLKRAPTLSPQWVREHLEDDKLVGPVPPLTRMQLWASYADECALPYVKVKLEAYYESLAENEYVRRASGTPLLLEEPAVKICWNEFSLRSARSLVRRVAQLLKKGFYRMYPVFLSLSETCTFALQVLYLFGATKCYTPLMFLMRITMARRQTVPDFPGAFIRHEADFARTSQQLNIKTVLPDRTWRQWLRENVLTPATPRYLLFLFVCSLKGVEWWYSEQVQSAREESGSAIKMVPPPPVKTVVRDEQLQDIRDPFKCPLCKKKRVNPTASPSGFVFCYACIHEHLESDGTCPVSGLACSIADLRKLYEST